MSSGASVRGSITSTESLLREQVGGDERLVDHVRERDDGDVRALPRDPRPAERDRIPLEVDLSPPPVQPHVLDEEDGVRVGTGRCTQEAVRPDA